MRNRRTSTVVMSVLAVLLLAATVLATPTDVAAAEPAGELPEIVATPPEAFVLAAYEDLLGRRPTVDELMSHPSMLTPADRASLLRRLTTSPEWISGIVGDLYRDTLGREGDPTGVAHWTEQIRTGRRTAAEVATRFHTSGEYVRRFGVDRVDRWAEDLYRVILRRDPANDRAGVAYWVERTERDGRVAVARHLYTSAESRRSRVARLYDQLLGRRPDAAGLAHWADRLTGEDDLTLAVHLAGGSEYLNRAWVRFGAVDAVAPIDVQVIDDGGGRVTVTWVDDVNEPRQLRGYGVRIHTDDEPIESEILPVDTRSHTVTGLEPGAMYRFGVAAFHTTLPQGAESPPTEPITLGP